MQPRWIWLPEAPSGIDVFVFARREFTVSSAGWVRARITADARYILYLNGVRIGRGPIRSEPRDRTFDEYEVALRAGVNVIGVLARHYGRPTLYWKPDPARTGGGILAEIDGVVVTEAAWRVLRAPYTAIDPAPAEGAPDNEWIDGRAWPSGWLEPGFDDASWAPAVEQNGPGFDALPPRPIAPLHERTLPMGALSLAADESRTLDLGTITNGHVSVEVRAAAGTTVALTSGEDLSGDEVLVDVRDWSVRYTAAGASEPERVDAFEPMGFRYLRVHADRPAQLEISVLERTYPRAPGARFACSDPALTAIWEAGARTLDLCSTDAFIDCPGREQRAWLGDDYVNSLISLVVNPDVTLPVHDLRMHAAAQRGDGLLPMVAAGDFTDRAHTLPDQSLLWICTLARLYEHTGDETLLRDLLPVAQRILDAFEAMRDPDGLLAGYVHGLNGWWFIDWAQIQRGDHIAAVDALYALALHETTKLYGSFGQDAEVCRERHERTRAAFERYWDPERGAYVDAAWRDGRTGRRVSQQTNSAAICAGLVPDDRLASIIERISDPARAKVTMTPGDGGSFGERLNRQWEDPPNFDDEHDVVAAQPFFTHFVHAALVKSGRSDLLLPSIRRWSDMVSRNGLVEEYWNALPGMGSRCHAWSGTPTIDLTRHVLGVRPLAAGWSDARVDPHLGDLDWAEGLVPTPMGWISVRAERGRPPRIEAPAGMTVSVQAPARWGS